MKLLSIAVISNERPQMLKKMMVSLEKISRNNLFEVFVCDNSVLNKEIIKEICGDFKSIGYYSNSGCNQLQNFMNALSISKGKFVCFAHDDDYFYFSDKDIESTKLILQKSKKDKIFYFKSISFSSEYRYFLYKFKGKISNPYSLKSFPFELPVFPSIVYPNSRKFRELFSYFHNGNFDCGKYSDIPFVESVLESYNYRASILSGFYIHIVHPLSDSSDPDYFSRLKLILHTFRKLNYIYYPYYFLKILIHSLKKTVRKFY